ncbi:cohesin domain-containing protein [Salinibacter ruber]|uniref:cohesin domain-containing protein n=1 Tax=Salinibacter ruber TaxID=146919 RepID=UPI0020738472|nr:cohesin domain-containing protein [Salinibacter ruber]
MANAAKLGHALLLLATVLALIPGVKSAGGQPVVSVESREAIRGDAVDVPLQLSGFGDIGAISLIIAYDPEVLSFPEGGDTDELISGAPRSDFSANVSEPGELRISWFDATGSDPISIGDGTLLQLSFDNYAGGTGPIALDPDSEIGNMEADPYGASYRDGEVRSAASQIEVSVQRQFESAVDASNYALVALPGRADVSLSETVVGRRGTAWRAFRELGATAGAESTGLEECTSQSSCTFRAGGGFWVIARGEWSFEGAVPEVVARDGTPSIPLQEGWNIISNPLERDIAWANVQAANGLQETLWRWEGESMWAEASTLRSATSGKAYYVFNGAGLDSLDLPVTAVGMGSSGTAPGSMVSEDTVSYSMASRGVALQSGSAHRTSRVQASLWGPRPPAWHKEPAWYREDADRPVHLQDSTLYGLRRAAQTDP